MPQGTKIATCCYCGTRAALILTGKTRHELSCQGCGAPLHDLKMMPGPRAEVPQPRAEAGWPTHDRPKHDRAKQDRRRGATPNPLWEQKRGDSLRRKKKKKPKKRGVGWFLEEAFDVIEDIFD
ncbi:hypothetical protein [Marinovum sp.]|uniref:hypothetical protein n=1 Tax=Marinovum sp. TaxID=2024839 RepID=UPI002B2729A8|nr:hypothetical protein [Marinovum sp.]